jgi:predicted metal-binding membrane protein
MDLALVAPLSPAERLSLSRPDRAAVWVGLGGLSLLSWAYLAWLSGEMGGVPLGSDLLTVRAWSSVDFAFSFLMWSVMMVGMMLPTALPMTLVYAAVARKALRQGTPVASTGVFVAGYVAMWSLFSAAAALVQWGLELASLLSPMMVSRSPLLGAALLGAAGVYQLSPWKDRCLEQCRAPAQFISTYWRPGAAGAFRMGLRHGAFCLGCCWALMGLLFVGGVMNLLWIAVITAFVLAEKLLPGGALGGRVAGAGMLGSAGWLMWPGLA